MTPAAKFRGCERCVKYCVMSKHTTVEKAFAGLLLKSDTLVISVASLSLTWQSEIELNIFLMLNISAYYFPNKITVDNHCFTKKGDSSAPGFSRSVQRPCIASALEADGRAVQRTATCAFSSDRHLIQRVLRSPDSHLVQLYVLPSCPLLSTAWGAKRTSHGCHQERAESRPRPHPGACERGPPGPGQLGRSVLKVPKPPAFSWAFLAHLRKSVQFPWVVSSSCTRLFFLFCSLFYF